MYIIVMSVGSRLKELRKELKISQKELGALLSVAQQVISYYENSGNIDASKLALISQKYNIDIRYFFDNKPLSGYRGTFLGVNSAQGYVIPVGWDNLLDEISELEYDKVKLIESVIKVLIKELSN